MRQANNLSLTVTPAAVPGSTKPLMHQIEAPADTQAAP